MTAHTRALCSLSWPWWYSCQTCYLTYKPYNALLVLIFFFLKILFLRNLYVQCGAWTHDQDQESHTLQTEPARLTIVFALNRQLYFKVREKVFSPYSSNLQRPSCPYVDPDCSLVSFLLSSELPLPYPVMKTHWPWILSAFNIWKFFISSSLLKDISVV